jgi:hypothetical protein
LRAFLKDAGPYDNQGVEITGIKFNQVSRSLRTGGVLSFTKHDFENANISDIKEYLWCRVEVKTDDLNHVVWEGTILRIIINNRRATFEAFDGLRVLDRVRCKHSSILVDGQVTAVGADYIDDSNESFTVALEGKSVIFTDEAGLDTETEYPNANSTIDGTPDHPIGTYANMQTNDGVYGFANDGDDVNLYIEIHFQVTNHALSERLDFEIMAKFLNARYYTEQVERPRIMVYDYDSSAWQHTTEDIEGDLSYVHEWHSWGGWCHILTSVVGNVANYMDGSGNCKVRINAGTPNMSSPTPTDSHSYASIQIATVKNTYSALFDAQEEIYVIDDVPSATRLTFTGQTPSADGIGNSDLYRIGDTLDTIADDIFKVCKILEYSIDFDTTLQADAEDYYNQYVGDVIRTFAEECNRKIWHAIGWTIKCKSSHSSTSLSLTDADIKDWEYVIDGEEMITKCVVYGASIESETLNYTGKYPCPQALIITDANITSQTRAYQYAASRLLELYLPKEPVKFEIDMDATGQDYSALYTGLGKTLDLTIDTDKVVLDDAIVESINYKQRGKGHLKATVVVKE